MRMQPEIHIDYLERHQETIPLWTEHFWNEWERFYRASVRSIEQVEASITERCETERLPLGIVALCNGFAAGTGCLKQLDLDERPQWTPWLAGIYVLPEYRRRGIGSQIVARLETEAIRLGYHELYLWTPSSEGLYASLGWEITERTRHLGEAITIMMKGIQ